MLGRNTNVLDVYANKHKIWTAKQSIIIIQSHKIVYIKNRLNYKNKIENVWDENHPPQCYLTSAA